MLSPVKCGTIGLLKKIRMNKDAIIEALIELGIIHQIGDIFFITDKYKELIDRAKEVMKDKVPVDKTPGKLDYNELLATKASTFDDWPDTIKDSTGITRVRALLDACEVPTKAKSGYRLRGIPLEVITVVNNIISSEEILPEVFIQGIKDYYAKTEMPKGVKNLFLDGDVLDIYQEYLMGDYIKSNNESNIKDNQKWR